MICGPGTCVQQRHKSQAKATGQKSMADIRARMAILPILTPDDLLHQKRGKKKAKRKAPRPGVEKVVPRLKDLLERKTTVNKQPITKIAAVTSRSERDIHHRDRSANTAPDHSITRTVSHRANNKCATKDIERTSVSYRPPLQRYREPSDDSQSFRVLEEGWQQELCSTYNQKDSLMRRKLETKAETRTKAHATAMARWHGRWKHFNNCPKSRIRMVDVPWLPKNQSLTCLLSLGDDASLPAQRKELEKLIDMWDIDNFTSKHGKNFVRNERETILKGLHAVMARLQRHKAGLWA